MRIAFKMKLKPGFEETYTQRHNPIWPELEAVLIRQGVKSYSIFLDQESDTLFAYAEIENLEKWKEIAHTDECQRWWRYMAPLMEVNNDNSPKEIELKQVFHIEQK